MLPSAYRLRHKSGFAAAYAKGRSYATDLVVVYVYPNKVGVTRFGFSVSKKLGKSVARNKVKRRLREAARTLLSDIAGAYDIIVIARSRAGDVEFSRLADSLKAALRKSGVIGGANG